jgi:cytochrome c biogenesis protein CcmG, thiol:disulfide interchange protein DsbE
MSAPARHFPRYKQITSALTLLFFVLWAGYLLFVPNANASNRGAGIAVGTPAPDFELKTVEGKTYKLSDLKGKPVMLNFWATWCPPCRAEMPIMEAVYKEYEAQGFVILAINLGESDVAIKSFRDRLGLTFPIVVDKDDKVTRMYDIVPLPTSYFVDKDGIVQGKWTGEVRSVNQLKELLKPIMQ